MTGVQEKINTRVQLLNVGLQRKYRGWVVEQDDNGEVFLVGENIRFFIPLHIMTARSAIDAFDFCEDAISTVMERFSLSARIFVSLSL